MRSVSPEERDYMKGLAQATKRIEDAFLSSSDTFVKESLKEALELLKARVLWPEKEAGRDGMYCEKCGLVMYARGVKKCPVCGSKQWYFITDHWQPPVLYGSVERKVCESCGAIVYGDIELCPKCEGKLVRAE